MKNGTTNILLAGVGGQGVLLASEILTEVAKSAGMDAKKSEVHGMSQRGGVVTSHVRFGEEVFSPLIPDGEVDALLALEIAEGLRWMHEISKGGKVVVNDQKIIPTIVYSGGGFSYPESPEKRIMEKNPDAMIVKAFDIASELGNVRLVNTIMLGALSQSLDIDEKVWLDVIERMAPKGTGELNKKAFGRGRSYSA
ncbi:MAG: indolepyruvate oxidoreductase subunit beta [Candidatus Latescibacteria bacterium]|nr:indolepyruvate oxidoreductase subunit beta [bacterium]MBD3424967.1 indolepyruvate oxidoreductase subunit beta [Candidatus Latescibacterota bacterium]